MRWHTNWVESLVSLEVPLTAVHNGVLGACRSGRILCRRSVAARPDLHRPAEQSTGASTGGFLTCWASSRISRVERSPSEEQHLLKHARSADRRHRHVIKYHPSPWAATEVPRNPGHPRRVPPKCSRYHAQLIKFARTASHWEYQWRRPPPNVGEMEELQ